MSFFDVYFSSHGSEYKDDDNGFFHHLRRVEGFSAVMLDTLEFVTQTDA